MPKLNIQHFFLRWGIYVFWVIYCIYEFGVGIPLYQEHAMTWRIGANYFLLFLVFYILNFLVGYWSARWFSSITAPSLKIIKITGLSLASLTIAIVYRKFVQPPLYGSSPHPNYLRYIGYWSLQFWYYALLGVGYFYLIKYFNKKSESEHLESERLRFEQAYLRSQINPHFLFNTLNHIYAKAIIYSPELGEKILLLSDVLRFAYEKNDGKESLITSLDQEVSHIKNIIKIYEYRMNTTGLIHLRLYGDIADVRIPSLIIATLVENIFKHGYLTTKTPAEVLLTHDAENRIFTYYSTNQVKYEKIKKSSTGIGLNNIRKRLSNFYPNNYVLETESRENVFYTRLKIFL